MKSVTLDKLQRPLKDLRISLLIAVIFAADIVCQKKYLVRLLVLSNDKILSFDEIERITRIFVSLGVKITDYRRRTVTSKRASKAY